MSSTRTINLTIGADLSGFALALFLYGITLGQVVLYFVRDNHRRRSLWGQCYVAVICFADTAQTVLLSSTLFYFVVAFHGQPSVFFRLVPPFGYMLMATEFSNLVVRLGYAYRIWKYNHRRILLPAIVVVCATAIWAVYMFYGVAETQMKLMEDTTILQRSIYAVFGFQLGIDAVIAAAMLKSCARFYTGLKSFDDIVQTIIVYVINTGVLGVILATAAMVLYVTMPGTHLYFVMYWILAKMHTCALLALLNAEKRLMVQTSQHAAKRDVPVLSTAIRIDIDLLPSSQLGIPDSLMGVGTPSSSSSQLIIEVPRNSYDLGTQRVYD